MVSKHEQKKNISNREGGVDTSSRHSRAQDSGFGSDSARIRIVQIEQLSGASHHRIARPLRKPSIVKNLNFIPFDIFVTASRVSLMTYCCTTASKPSAASQEQKECEKVGKSALNMSDNESDVTLENPSSQLGISVLTADDLLNSNTSSLSGKAAGNLSLESLHTPSRSSARHALGVTIVRQPGRRGTSDLMLEPLLYLVVSQPSLLLSCHHRKQKLALSMFDTVLKGVAMDYKCSDKNFANDDLV
ncbi:UNVERIFIED_CONTAM: hypothetical protein FKN15_016980 [Acipenser sinensis]